MKFTRNRVVVTGLGLLAAAGIAVVGSVAATSSGSGASFTSSGQVNMSGSVGTVTLRGASNPVNLAFTKLAPGTPQSQTYYVVNDGSLPAVASVHDLVLGNYNVPSGALTQDDLSKLSVTVTSNGQPVGLNGGTVDLGKVPAHSQITVVVTVGLDSSAGNDWQGATGSAHATETLTQDMGN